MIFSPTHRHTFRDGRNRVQVEVENSENLLAWRMRVNDSEWSDVFTDFAGILLWHNYGLATGYWSPALPEFVPFRIMPAIRESTRRLPPAKAPKRAKTPRR